MKSIHYKIFSLVAVAMAAGMWSCSDPDVGEPNIATTATGQTANFLFVNATPDAPDLDLYINNEKTGTSLSQGEAWTTYQTVPITANGVFANTNIRAKGSAGQIGGTLSASDLIYRAGNNNSNNFQATGGVSYTIFAVDSINRPKPTRTLNKDNFGDVTYYSPVASFVAKRKVVPDEDTTIVLNVGSNNSVITANLLKKYNGNALPSFFIPIGTVPLGSSDPGGVRFYLLQDFFPADAADKAGIRFVALSPNAPTLYARLVPSLGGPTLAVSAGAAYALSQGSFNPTVGSRTVTVTSSNFPQFTIASTGTPIDYTLEISTKSDFSSNIIQSIPNVTFEQKKSYTIYVSGLVGENLQTTIIKH